MIQKILFLSSILFIFNQGQVSASESQDEYQTGTVTKVESEEKIQFPEGEFYIQELMVKLQNDPDQKLVKFGSEYQPLQELQKLSAGDSVILAKADLTTEDSDEAQDLLIYEAYRLPTLIWLAIGFFLIVLAVAGYKGMMSILGMFISVGVLMTFVIPQILGGANALLITIIAAFLISTVTVYLSHGWKLSSHLALVSILTTLLFTTILSYWFVYLSRLSGLGSEEAAFLQVEHFGKIDFRGLLLSGIILGALGVLDDIAVTQVATVFELKRANVKLGFIELYEGAMRVGRDHVASLVNTLVLAYAGANLPLFLLFSTSIETPTWVHLNSALIAEEIVRTLIGSIGLVVAVPITTALAAYWSKTISKSDLKHISAHKH